MTSRPLGRWELLTTYSIKIHVRQRADSHLCVGGTAPDFKVMDADDRPFRLSHELGERPIILVFYPSDFGVVCSIQMREFKKNRERFDSFGYRVVWMSTDTTENHRRWRSKMDIPFQLLSDNDGSVSRLYGVFIEEEGVLKKFSNRSIFVIQTDRCITYKWVAGHPAISPDLNEVLDSIA